MATGAVKIGESVDSNPDKIQWWSMRSKRTQAIPKNTLFGTPFERVDREELNNIEGRYIPEGYIRPIPNRYPLPSYLEDESRARAAALESSRQEVISQRNVLREADNQLNFKAQQALAFSEAPHRSHQAESSEASEYQNPNWLSKEDIEHSKEINIIGLNDRGSYNRDKYGPKPVTHSYSHLGNILMKNMDTTSTDKPLQYPFPRSNNVIYSKGRHLPYSKMKETEEAKKKQASSMSVLDLPPNIRHTFGSRVCDNLLCDEKIVERSIEKQRQLSGPPRPSKKDNVQGLPLDMEGNYSSLGHTTRYNVFPGLTTGHKISATKQEFNDEVHHRRVPNPDEYRYQRDELSTWNEHNVLRERMKKAWNEAHPLGGKKE